MQHTDVYSLIYDTLYFKIICILHDQGNGSKTEMIEKDVM